MWVDGEKKDKTPVLNFKQYWASPETNDLQGVGLSGFIFKTAHQVRVVHWTALDTAILFLENWGVA